MTKEHMISIKVCIVVRLLKIAFYVADGENLMPWKISGSRKMFVILLKIFQRRVSQVSERDKKYQV